MTRNKIYSRFLFILFRSFGKLLPGMLVSVAYKLWTSTRRYPVPKREQSFLQSAICEDILVSGNAVRTYRWGEGTPVLLVHGWNGRATQLFRLINPLVQRAYCVVAFDAPAHGYSAGSHTTLAEMSAAIQEIGKHFGTFRCVIAHSIGGLAVLMTAARYKLADRIVCISCPSRLDAAFRQFVSHAGLPQRLASMLEASILARMGADYWEKTSATFLSRDLNTVGLVIHDTDDKSVPVQAAGEILQTWENAQSHLTSGLGHTRILYSEAVIAKVIEFADT